MQRCELLSYNHRMISKLLRALTIAAVCVSFLSACATQRSGAAPDLDSAEGIYNQAKSALNQGDFLTAIDIFETLGARYPFGTFTQQAQLDVAYAYLKQDDFDSAISTADRFIKLYPRSEQIDYAYYIKGVSHFSRGGSALERIFPRDMSAVNQNWLRSAFAEFDTLVRRFPDSQYSGDARERGAMVAVVNRVNSLLTQFDGSKHVPNALALMANAYQSLGQADLQSDTLRVLSLTDPGHPALKGLPRS